MRADHRRLPANDHPLSNHYHGRLGLSSASHSGDSNQPDPAPCHPSHLRFRAASRVAAAPRRPPATQAATETATKTATKTEEEVTIRAVQQEKDGPVYHLRGAVEIHYRTYILDADQVTYDTDSGDTELEGHVVLDGGPYDEHVEASHGAYNIRTETGIFYSVVGTIGLRLRKSRYALTTSNPFAFTGKVVEKQGPDHYLVRQGP